MASTGWVSFDDDNGASGFAFGAPTAPAPAAVGVAPASAPTGWAQQFAAAGPAPTFPAQYPVPAPLAGAVPGSSPPAPAAAAAPGAGAASLTPAAREHLTTPAASPPAPAPAAQSSVFPSFAALYGVGNAPAAAAAGPYGPAPPSTSAPCHVSTSAPVAALPMDPAAAGSAIQRLPRPPTSAARGLVPPPAAAAAGAANPFSSQAVPPAPSGLRPPGASSNPFAASANPMGATAAARSLDPFADLSVRPALPRPPPMGSSRSPTTTSFASAASTAAAAAAAASVGPSPAGVLGLGADPGGVLAAGLPAAQAVAAGLAGALQAGSVSGGASRGLMRPPTSASTSGSAAQAASAPAATAPVAAPAPPSAFPTFAALYQQHHPSAQQPQFLDAAAPTPAAAAAGPGAPPVAASTPHGCGSATWQGSGPLSGPDQGVIETTTFDAFLPVAKSPPTPPQGQPDVLAAAPPPPPYAVAVNLPDAAAPSVLDGGVAGLPQGLLPPPPYMEALNMPDAQPPLPPPSYDEAVALPAAEHALARSARPLPRSDSTRQPDRTAFDDDVFGLHAAARAGPAPPAPPAPAKGPAAAAPPLPDQICVEVRLPPLKPKGATWPKRLVAGMGLLFAAPGGDGVAALQWWLHAGGGEVGQGAAQGHAPGQGQPAGPHFALPPGAGAGAAQAAAGRSAEDADSAPAASVVLPPPVSDLSATCCMLLDDVSGSLWTGHKDGRVVRWIVEPGRTAAYEHHWRAHVRGKITYMTLSPWGDLWTASSAGSIRAWQYQTGMPASRPPVKLFECRRCRVTMGPVARPSAQRAHSKARLLCLGPSGRVVWSAGRTGMALWGAYDGDFLGTITPGLTPGQEARAGGAAAGATGAAYAGDTGAMVGSQGQQQQQQLEINPQTGLDASVISRAFTSRQPLDPSEEADGGDRDPDLGLQVMKGLAGAAKLAVRLGKKIRQNIVESTGVGAASEAGAASEMYGVSPGSRGKEVALLAGLDSSVYVAYQRGWLDKYTEWGKLLWSRDYGRHVELRSAALVGASLWLGCGDGAIRTASAASGELGGAWKAADFSVVALAHDAGPSGRGSGLVYSLSENGSVRGWPAVPPAEAQRLAWRNGLLPSLRPHKLTVLAATWNVNETRPAPASLHRWLQPAAAADIVSIALQEVEMGTSSVAWDAAVTLLSKSMLERGNQNAQWWSTELSSALAATGGSWERVALRQMSGLVIVVFCRRELAQHVGEVATANVACGVMGVGGNKGAVAVSMSVFRRRVMFVCSHFAAHQERVEERNENYNKIVRMLHFDNTSKAAAQQQLQLQQQQQQAGEGPGAGDSDADALGTPASRGAAAAGASTAETQDDGHGPGLSDAALLVWAGDFNYRLNGSYEEVCELSCTGALGKLFRLDQCRLEMDKGNVFRGLREPLPLGHPVFVPTYKYDKNESHKWIPPAEPGGPARLQLPFDSSEKQRVPAWTDRVFYRGSRPGSLDVAAEEVSVIMGRPADYNCVLEVTDSDHKPVFALLQVQLPGYEQEQKRRHSLASAFAVHAAALSAPGGQGAAAVAQLQQLVRASASRLKLQPFITSVLDIQNASSAAFTVHVMAERRAGLASGPHNHLAPLPSWLEVSPTTFFLGPRLEDGYGGAGGSGSPGQTRVHLRVLGGDCARATEALLLRFVLRPLWGCETLAGAPGPAVTLAVR
ncbi:hypothetical protein PLESTM_001431000 [Pleodorina starrii]|nr:hypothetical protein PLESTM_001431000 [Pleodorina starrii]